MPDLLASHCEVCGKEQPTWALSNCPMCAKTVCRKCATFEYGRVFCSKNCAVLFFHGDEDEDESPLA